MGKRKVKLAVIGVGYWGRNLARVFSGLGVLSTICDTSLDNLKKLRKDYPKTNIVLSFSEVLRDDGISAVVISTPAETHYKLAKEAFLAGKDVFVEKPLSLTVEQGRELVDLAKKNKKILMVGHLLEFHPAVDRLKKMIKAGDLGKIQYIYSNRLNLGKIRREENILWSFAPHDISVILSLLGEMPTMISAHGASYLDKNIVDVTVSNFSFPTGVNGHIFVSWLHPYKEQKLVVVGDKKMVVFDDVAHEDKLLVFNHKIDWIDRVPVPKKENAKRVEFKMEEPLLLECKHFIRCINTRMIPRTNGQSALNVLVVLQACQRSLENQGISIVPDYHKKDFYPKPFFAHPSSVIEEPCQIGKGTKIWHYAHIMKGARIGENCNIGQNVFIGAKVELGNNVKVQNNVSIYDGVKLEDNVFCGPAVTFTNVINPRSHISRRGEYKETIVSHGATLGANSTIVCGNAIGKYAFVGAGSVVTHDVPDYALFYGNPARQKGWVCKCGEKIKFNNKTMASCVCGLSYIIHKNILRPYAQ